MKLIIGNKNYSSWSLRPWLLLSHHQIPFEEVRIALFQPSMAAAMAEHSPSGKVPVLHDGDLAVWDSLAICEYLSERYLDGAGWPSATAARARARSCASEMHSGFVALRSGMPMNCRASGRRVPHSDELERDIHRIDTLWSTLRSEHAQSGPWLFGEFSIVDCMFAPVASRFHTYGVQLSAESLAYSRKLLEHEAMVRWYADAMQEPERIDDAEVGEG